MKPDEGQSQSQESVAPAGQQTVANTKSIFSMFSSVLPTYFGSEWSFAQCRLVDSHVIVAIKDTHLIAVSLEGNYYLAEIDPKNGGECAKSESRPLLPSQDFTSMSQ